MRRYFAYLFVLVTAIASCRRIEPGGDSGGQGGAGATSNSGPTSSAAVGGSFSVDLKLASWNVQDFPKTPQASTALRAFVEEQSIHLLGIQEIDNAQAFTDLGAQLDGFETVMNDDPKAFLRVGLLYDTRRIELSEVETIFFDNKYAFPRPPLKARVQARLKDNSVFDFTVMVIHLKASFDAESEERRRAAIKIIESWVSSNLDQPDKDFIVLGDWNDKLADTGNDNVFLPLLNKPETFTFITEPLEESGQYSFIPSKSFIDHVLVTNSVLPFLQMPQATVHNLEMQSSNFEQNVSDHRPVTLSLIP